MMEGDLLNNIEGMKVLIVGLERSGTAAAKLLTSKGAEVTAIDAKQEIEIRTDLKPLRSLGIKVLTGDNSLKRLNGMELLVISPGVPLEHPLVREASVRGIPATGELEIAYRFWNKPVIAVTGTNGKSTTTALIGHILRTAGIRAVVAGNIGFPFSDAVESGGETAVVEVSSFQLETVDTFKPRIAVWLNLTTDHLGRHGDIARYTETKGRIFQRQDSGDAAVYNNDDPMVKKFAEASAGEKVPFSFRGKYGVFIKDDAIWADLRGVKGEICPLKELQIRGKHNIENAMAASGAAAAFGVDIKVIREGLGSFTGIEHRQEVFLRHNGVTFVNDSKATNLDSTLKALETFDPPLILLAGGRGKGESYAPAKELVMKKVKLMIAFGEAAEDIQRELSGGAEMMFAADMASAVKLALENAAAGDTVILSPMCASFDMFRDFEERGRVFKNLIRGMVETAKA